MTKEKEIVKEENEEVKEEAKKVKHRKKLRFLINLIIDLLALGLLLFVIFETVIAFLGFNEVKEGKTPAYYTKITQDEKEGNTRTIYNFGLYKAVKIENTKTYSYKLLPFFLD